MHIDISQPSKELLPKAETTVGGIWRSLGLLSLALTGAILAGVLGYFGLRLLFPVPVYSGIIIGLVALILLLQVIARRFSWIMPWYYVLPALLFLLTFTFFPVILTIILGFTDYAGIRNGELNISSETQVAAYEPGSLRLSLQNPATLNCSALRNGCTNISGVFYASGIREVSALSFEENILTLEETLAPDQNVVAVELELSELGFAARFPVSEVDGAQLTLERAPPGEVNLENVRLELDRSALQRRIASVDGDQLTLVNPLPEGFVVQSVARYNDFGWVGWDNFRIILEQANRALIPVFTWNVIFAVATVIINTAAGVFLAVLLNNPNLRFRALYRTLLIIPWALPNIITIQVWKGFLNQNFGAINRLLMLLDITPEPINWLLGTEWPARGAVLLVNLWLGYPFMMVATLGALSAIPSDVYEAAKIDGANAWQSFWGVTAPLLRTALVPIVLTGFAFNFNNFNIVFLLTDGGPPVSWGTSTARGTDILISWAYNEAFRSQGGFAYGLGSAISVLIFIITVAISLINFRVTGALKEERAT